MVKETYIGLEEALKKKREEVHRCFAEHICIKCKAKTSPVANSCIECNKKK